MEITQNEKGEGGKGTTYEVRATTLPWDMVGDALNWDADVTEKDRLGDNTKLRPGVKQACLAALVVVVENAAAKTAGLLENILEGEASRLERGLKGDRGARRDATVKDRGNKAEEYISKRQMEGRAGRGWWCAVLIFFVDDDVWRRVAE